MTQPGCVSTVVFSPFYRTGNRQVSLPEFLSSLVSELEFDELTLSLDQRRIVMNQEQFLPSKGYVPTNR